MDTDMEHTFEDVSDFKLTAYTTSLTICPANLDVLLVVK